MDRSGYTLEQEQSPVTELDPRWAIRLAALVRHRDRIVLVPDDPGGEALTPSRCHRAMTRCARSRRACKRVPTRVVAALAGVPDQGRVDGSRPRRKLLDVGCWHERDWRIL